MGCGNGSHTTVTVPQTFELRFHAVSGAQDVNCAQALTNMGTGHVTAHLQDLALFIHGLTFIKEDGSHIIANLDDNAFQSQNVALLDFQDRSDSCLGSSKPTHTILSGSIADATDIKSVQFTLGVPDALNHVDPQSVKTPLNATNMFWSWQGGYKSLRFDIAPDGGITRPTDPNFSGTNFFFHLGSTDCSGDPIAGETVRCQRMNQPLIKLGAFDLSSEINIDIAALLNELNLNVDRSDSPGCMSSQLDTECQSFFAKLGLDLNSGNPATGLSQSVFSLKK